VEERYKNISEVARTRSIISIGLSCFKAAKGSAQGEPFHCDVQTFNLMTLCTEDYVVEPPALQFLVNHGFDFHKQYSSGIPYYRGCDKVSDRTFTSPEII
jgi:target of EGR1 protein 1